MPSKPFSRGLRNYRLQTIVLAVESRKFEVIGIRDFISNYQRLALSAVSNYMEVDMKIYKPKTVYYQVFLSIKHKFWARFGRM